MEPEKVLINMEVNYFRDDRSFHLCIIIKTKCKAVVGSSIESISTVTQERNEGGGVVINES